MSEEPLKRSGKYKAFPIVKSKGAKIKKIRGDG
jgi:hypothetical protein